MYDSAGSYQLLVGAVNGYIYQYNNIDNNINGIFTLVDSMFYDIHEPERVSLDVADLDGDGINEIVTGNFAGGLSLYKFDATIGLPAAAISPNTFSLYPNPVSDELFVRFNTPFYVERDITLMDMLGREVDHKLSGSNVVLFETSKLASGMYHCRVVEGSTVNTLKFLVK